MHRLPQWPEPPTTARRAVLVDAHQAAVVACGGARLERWHEEQPSPRPDQG